MKLRLATLAFCLLPTWAYAINSNIYEKTKDEKSFSAKVRVVREVSEDVEVFFDSDKAKGAYTLPKSMSGYAAALKALEDSKKTGIAVTVTADDDNRIHAVQAGAAPAAVSPEDMQKELQKQYDAILKKK